MQEHTGTPLWAKVSQDNNSLLTLFDGAALNSLDEIIFTVKRTGFPGKSESLLACNLCHGTSGRKVAFQNPVDG